MMNAPDTPEDLLSLVGRSIERRHLLPRGQTIVLGVSGGADSVAMLWILRELSAERKWRLHVAHLNHQLRPEADDDEAFVRCLAQRWQVGCTSQRQDIAACARRRGVGIEEAARDIRYDFLLRTARDVGASRVAVAHHADDQVETVLHHVLRGTHLRGLRGIPACRRLDEEVLLVRPLLDVRRGRLEELCRAQGLEWRTDATNLAGQGRRSLLRTTLLPLLRAQVNPQVDQALLRLASAADQVEDLLQTQGRELLEKATCHRGRTWVALSAAVLARHAPLVRTYALREALGRLGLGGKTLTADHLERLASLAEPGAARALALPGGLRARREGGEVVLAGRNAPRQPEWGAVDVACPGLTPLPDGRCARCELLHVPGLEGLARREAGAELLDADEVQGTLRIRPRRRGDRFQGLGAEGTQTVSDLLTNVRLPRRQRETVLVITDDVGIVYVSPVRLAHRVRLRDATRRVLRLAVDGEVAGQ